MKRIKKALGLIGVCLLSTFLCAFTDANNAKEMPQEEVPIFDHDYKDFSYTAELRGTSSDGTTLFYEFTIKNIGTGYANLGYITAYYEGSAINTLYYNGDVFHSSIVEPNKSVKISTLFNKLGDYDINNLTFSTDAYINKDESFVFNPSKCSLYKQDKNFFRVVYYEDDYVRGYCRYLVTIEYNGVTYTIDGSGNSLNDVFINSFVEEDIDSNKIIIKDAKRYIEYFDNRSLSSHGCSMSSRTIIILISVLLVGAGITATVLLVNSSRKKKINN